MDQKKKLILIITDSVALPREHKNGIVHWNDIYIAKLKKTLPDYEIINISMGGASIKDLRLQMNYYKILEPDIVILHCGIVDASPRGFGRIELELIKKARLMRLTKPLVNFLRKYRAHHYASESQFERLLLEIIQMLRAKSFYSLGIIPALPEYEYKLPGISKSIDRYNRILKRHTSFISLAEIPKRGILPDYHHINAIGHDFILKQIATNLGFSFEAR